MPLMRRHFTPQEIEKHVVSKILRECAQLFMPRANVPGWRGRRPIAHTLHAATGMRTRSALLTAPRRVHHRAVHTVCSLTGERLGPLGLTAVLPRRAGCREHGPR